MKQDLDHYLSLSYPVELIREEGGVFAFHPDLDGCAAQGATVDEALANLDDARMLWIKTRLEDGLPIEEPTRAEQYSGRVLLRMPSALHADLAKIARRQGVSLNQLMNTALAEYAGGSRMASQLLATTDRIKAMLSYSRPSPEEPAGTARERLTKRRKP